MISCFQTLLSTAACGSTVRSFARIHETNLKKQGMLPLTFADPGGAVQLDSPQPRVCTVDPTLAINA